MSETNRDIEREERIARLVSRRGDRVAIPPFWSVERRLAMRNRLPLAALSTAAVLIIAIVVGGVLASRRASVTNPSATPLPTNSAAPTGSTQPPAILNGRFGFVWHGQGTSGVIVRPETGQGGFDLPTQPYRFSECSCAVSPDGTRIAYWSGSTPGNVELRVVDVNRAGLGTVIYKPPRDQHGVAVAWSSDSTGIVFSLEGWPKTGDPAGVITNNTAMLVIEASGGTARTLATGYLYVPLGWDRTAGIAAAGVSGEGGYMTGYAVVHTSGDPAPQLSPMPDQIFMGSVQVSGDQRFVLGTFFTDQQTTLRWWRLSDPKTMSSGRPVPGNIRPVWRPASKQIAWIENDTLQLLDIDRGLVTSAGTLPGGNSRPLAFRLDGSAVSTGPLLLEIASGRTTDALVSGGSIVGSVVFNASASTTPSPRSTIAPSDINVSAELVPVGDFAVDGKRGYVIDMRFENTGPDGDYDIDVYPYAADALPRVIDFGEGFDPSGRVIGGAGITIGSNGSQVAAASEALRSATPSYPVPASWQPEGVSMIGKHAPLQVRFQGIELPDAYVFPPGQFAIVVVYSAPHGSQSVSWTKVVPMTMPTSTSGPSPIAVDQNPTAAEQALIRALVAFARAPGAATFAAVPFAETVALGLADQLQPQRPSTDLARADAWLLQATAFRGYVGPLSALDLLTKDVPTTVMVGPHRRCASPAAPDPSALAGARRISIQPVLGPEQSCLQWWSVDVFVTDSGRIEAVTLDLYEP